MPILLSSPKNDILVGWPVLSAGRGGDVSLNLCGGVSVGGKENELKIESLNLCGGCEEGVTNRENSLFVGYTHGV